MFVAEDWVQKTILPQNKKYCVKNPPPPPPSNNKSVFKRFDIHTVLFLITEMDERNGAWWEGGGGEGCWVGIGFPGRTRTTCEIIKLNSSTGATPEARYGERGVGNLDEVTQYLVKTQG